MRGATGGVLAIQAIVTFFIQCVSVRDGPGLTQFANNMRFAVLIHNDRRIRKRQPSAAAQAKYAGAAFGLKVDDLLLTAHRLRSFGCV